jgi:hypothetical protein
VRLRIEPGRQGRTRPIQWKQTGMNAANASPCAASSPFRAPVLNCGAGRGSKRLTKLQGCKRDEEERGRGHVREADDRDNVLG